MQKHPGELGFNALLQVVYTDHVNSRLRRVTASWCNGQAVAFLVESCGTTCPVSKRSVFVSGGKFPVFRGKMLSDTKIADAGQENEE